MGRVWNVLAACGLLVLTAGCSSSVFHQRNLDSGQTQVFTVDAKQRSILTSLVPVTDPPGGATSASRRRFCAEPSPDVFSVVAQALSAGGSFSKSADPASIQAALNAAFSSSEQGSTIPRTQTINMLRELMYRTCERYLSGGYDELELSVQAIRDQRLMVSILAIEQLTGAVTPKPVVIAATGSGGAGASGEAIVLLDAARKARDKAAAAYATATGDYEKVNGEAKVCDAIKDKPEAGLTDEQEAKVKPCADARAAQNSALEERTTTAAAYEELSTLARSGGVTVTTATSSTAPGGLDTVSPEAISDVGAKVETIVQANFNDSTEVMLFCLRALRDKSMAGATPTQAADLKALCVSYLGSSVQAAEQRLAEEIGRSVTVQREANAANFARFWTAPRQAAFADANQRAAFVSALRPRLTARDQTLADCFAAATSPAQVESCFVALPLSAQRELIR
ncbi:hypothetical protein PMI01_00941 [Caulobacter sp. AP07]|uniref:hypothetical protein n=1 Tax=Caulobacter sp. AP07 TaxID=1144304 RepID=UPI0002721ACA|nr:hypothetical protein [Caulobacter sp. AP07]EJL36586.1 hypothetical protein PMI01_00941 [Caulobacter sp. AP07]